MSLRGFFFHPAWRGFWLGLVCALAVWGLTWFPFFQGVEDWLLDGCFF